MGRSLGAAEYGILGSLLAAFYILFVPLGAISTVVTKFVSEFKAREEYGKVASLLFSGMRKLSRYAILIFIGLSVSSWLIADFLRIPSPFPVILMGLLLVLAIVLSVPRGVLRGLQRFSQFGLNISLEALIRLLLGVLLVSLGLGVNGAILAYGLGYLAAILLALMPLRFLFHVRNETMDVSSIYKFSLPALTMSICLAVMTNVDIIFVKHFFTSEEAGIYTVVSVLGKVIFFVSSAFTIPMFPLVSELHTKGENTLLILKKSLFYVISFSGIVIAAYWLSSSFIVHALYGAAYPAAVPLLGAMGIAMGLIALVMVYTTYLLALKDMRFVKVLLGCTFFEILLLWLFHHTLLEVIHVLVLTGSITLFLLFLSRSKIIKRT
jgi:O-antigen/teichoic acid export membrane protein